MTLSPGQAAESLKEIERTQRRSTEAMEYVNASPFFTLYGVVWAIGYAGTDLIPRLTGSFRPANWLWASLMVISTVICVGIGRQQYRAQYPGAREAGRRQGQRWLGSLFVVWVFIAALAWVVGPRWLTIQGAFFPLLAAMFYGLLGVWRGLRFLYVGVAVTALTLGGWFYLPHYFLLWMAAVGGGSLILVGLWLRKV